MSKRVVTLEQTEGIARITIDDESNHNAVSSLVAKQLAEAALEVEDAGKAKVVVLRSVGDKFSVGGDLNEFLSEKHRLRPFIREMASWFHLGITVLNRLPVPLVCGVNGIAGGGGFSLVCMSDLAIAKRSAKLCLAYTRMGLTPDGGSSWFLPRLVGMQKAYDIMATNPTLTAEEACELGIIARVVDDKDFDQELEAVVQQLAKSPSNAAGQAKRLLRSSVENSLEQQLELEAQSVAFQAAAPETLASMEAFFSRTK